MITDTAKLFYHKYLSLSAFVRFFIHLAFLFILFIIFYRYIRYNPLMDEIYELAVLKLTNFLLYSSQYIFSILDMYSIVKPESQTIILEDTRGVQLLRGCLGRNVIVTFIGLIIAFPGPIRTKLWYIPLGVFLINILNISRMIAISLIMKYLPDANIQYHHDIFNYILYILIFFMMALWIQKFRTVPSSL